MKQLPSKETSKPKVKPIEPTDQIHERFEQMIITLGLNKNQFAKKLGIATTQVYNITNKRNAPSYGMLANVAKNFPAVNLTWLLLGHGPVLNQGIEPNQNAADLVARVKFVEDQLKMKHGGDGDGQEDDLAGMFEKFKDFMKKEKSGKGTARSKR